MAKLVIPEEIKVGELNNEEKVQIKILAKIKRQLNIYAATHKKDLVQLKQNILELDTKEKTTENKDILLKSINEIQTKYKIFGRFVPDEDLEQLYKLKFDILMIDINKLRESPLKEITNQEELEYYKKIIEKKIQDIVQGTNPNLNKMFGKDKLQKVVKIINTILKDGQKILDIEKILKDKLLLSLIIAFDKEDGLEKVSLNKENVNIDLYEDVFEWEDQISLKTIFQLKEYEDEFIAGEDNLYFKLYDMYKENSLNTNDVSLLSNNGYEKVFKLPEGITKTKSIEFWTDKNRYSESKLIYEIKDSNKIILPSTLKKIEKGLFWGNGFYTLEEIEFNEGLQEIGEEAFYENRILGRYKTLNLPSSLKRIGKKAFFNCYELMINLNEGIEEIGDYAFNFGDFWEFTEFSYGKKQRELYLPSSVKYIGKEIVDERVIMLVTNMLNEEKRIGTLIYKSIFVTIHSRYNFHLLILIKQKYIKRVKERWIGDFIRNCQDKK